MKAIEGMKPDKFIQANIGNGYASYALVDGQWYSVNGTADEISEVRWTCSVKERDQIIAILASRMRRNS